VLRITLKDVTGLWYLTSSQKFPQLQDIFPRTIRGARVKVLKRNVHQFVTIFAELKFGNRRLRIQATTNKKSGGRKPDSKSFSNGKGRGTRGRSTARSEGKNKSFSLSQNRFSGKPANRKKNTKNQRAN
jgi:hypothetical protein